MVPPNLFACLPTHISIWNADDNPTRPTNWPLVHKVHLLPQRVLVRLQSNISHPSTKPSLNFAASHHPVTDLIPVTVHINFPFNFSPTSLASPVNSKTPRHKIFQQESVVPSSPDNLSYHKNNRIVAFLGHFHQFLLMYPSKLSSHSFLLPPIEMPVDWGQWGKSVG